MAASNAEIMLTELQTPAEKVKAREWKLCQ